MTLTNAIKEGFSYERRTAKGTQSPLQTLATRRGSCRDFATLMMEAARALGFAARFVSGYLYVPSRDAEESHLGGGSTHAWCQVYLPGSGWVEFDPTNGIVGNRDLIRVAVARDARQAIPLARVLLGQRRRRRGHGGVRQRPAPAGTRAPPIPVSLSRAWRSDPRRFAPRARFGRPPRSTNTRIAPC